MKDRPQDIQDMVSKYIEDSIQNEFTDSEREGGYAQWMATWWHELPENMSNENARIYLGIAAK